MKVVVSLLPDDLADKEAAIRDHLSRFLLRYTEGAGGIMLAFSDVKTIGKGGAIVNELPHIHYTVQLDALVFSPTKGAKLKGKVTESFQSHVSLVVCNYFNASIAADKLKSMGFQYSADLEEWANEESGVAIYKDSSITFVVDRVHESGGIISIEGSKPTIE